MTVATRTPITLRDVTKRFRRGGGEVTAVERVSLVMMPGTFAVVSGPSGSGKTTLLNLALGWERPDDGVVDGVPHRPDWSEVAVVPQRLGLLDHLTVAENVALPVRRHVEPETVAAVLRRLRLDHLADRFPPETSLGEQQRTAVARALLVRPAVLVADEPSAHQDEANTATITDELVAAARDGAAVLVATHDARIADRADRIYRMRDGVLTELV